MPPRSLLKPLTPHQFASPHLKSTVALGTSFELSTLKYLSSAPWELELIRVGGRSDKGVDLRGWCWEYEKARSGGGKGRGKRWPVLVQCKAEKSRIGPSTIRELEGVLGYERALSSSRFTSSSSRSPPPPTIGLLVSLAGFSSEALMRMLALDIPMGLIHLDNTVAGGKGGAAECKGVAMNDKLRELVGERLQVGVRWRSLDDGKNETGS